MQSRDATLAVVASSNLSPWRANLYLVCLLAAIAVFHLATLRDGHLWGDDFAMYIHHAQNLVEGRPYADTGYVFNPAVPVYGPRAYPPVFPLLLVPLCGLFGLNLMPMKVEQVFFILMTLTLVFMLWRRDLGTGYSLALVAILGFSPALCSAKDSILSDLPFLFFFYAAVLLLKWTPQAQPQLWIRSALLGLTLYLAIGTRTVGITLIPGLLFHEWLRYKRINRWTGLPLLLCAMALVAQSWFLGALPGGYLEQLHSTTAGTVAFNALRYSRTLAGFWAGSVSNAFSFSVLAVIAPLTVVGLLSARRDLLLLECLLAPYLMLMIFWPFGAGMRYALPVVPWMAFLALSGLRRLSTRYGPRAWTLAPCGLLLLLALSFGQAYRGADFGTIRESTGLPEFNQLCETVRKTTLPSDVFIYYRARALSLYTQRPASSYNYRGTPSELWEYAQKIRASYIITTNAFNDEGFLARFVEAHSTNLELAYQNAHFRLYRIRFTSGPASASRPDSAAIPPGIVKW